MRLCDTTLMTTAERSAFPDWMVGVMQDHSSRQLMFDCTIVQIIGSPERSGGMIRSCLMF
jgi:hypothetical protein